MATSTVRAALSDAETELVLGAPEASGAALGTAGAALDTLLVGQPRLAGQATVALNRARSAAADGDETAFAAEAARIRAIVLRAGVHRHDPRDRSG